MFNQAFVNIKSYEFNLTLKKAMFKKGSYLHKEKNFTEKMDEVRARNKIEVEIHQKKVDSLNDAYEKELRYLVGGFRELFNGK